MNRRLTTFACLFLSAACIFAGGNKKNKNKEKQPEWINNPTSVYAESTYITGVGSAKKRSDAENDAIAAVGKYIKQTIQAEEKTTQAYSSSGSGSESYLSDIKTQTTIKDLAGVSIKENYTASDGTDYALAVLNRNESGSFYRGKVEENNNAISQLLSEASKKEGSIESCSNAMKAYSLALENDYYLSLLAIIKPVYKKSAEISSTPSNVVAQKVSDLLSKINILISVDGDTNGRIAGALANSLAKLGIKTFGGTSGGENIRYTLFANVSYEPVTVNASNYFFCRYNISVEMIDKTTGKNVLPWSKNARVGKLSAQEAESAAVKALETVINNEFANAVSASLK